MLSGIYAIWRNGAEKCYVGSSQDMTVRWNDHKYRLTKGTHHSRHLQNAWNKYGAAAFSFAVLELCPVDVLLEREQYFLDTLRPHYNTALDATAPNRGLITSPETRAKLSAANTGRVRTPAMRAQMRDAWTRRLPATAETRRKMSLAHTRLTVSQAPTDEPET